MEGKIVRFFGNNVQIDSVVGVREGIKLVCLSDHSMHWALYLKVRGLLKPDLW